MTVLRDEFEMALNDLIVVCRDAAAQHQAGAEASADADLARALEDLSRARQAAADHLAEIVAARGDIPNSPEHESELLDAAITRLKAALSEDEAAPLLDDSEAKEARVAEAVDAALSHTEDAELRSWLEDLRRDVRGRIDGLRGRIGGP